MRFNNRNTVAILKMFIIKSTFKTKLFQHFFQ